MEILSFILGIALVVVIAVAIVAVYAFVKVGKLENSIKEFDIRESNIYQNIASEIGALHRRIDDFEKDIYSQLDSRLDKLETKLTNKK